MPQSIYSYYGSRLHLILEDRVAEGYNRFLESWYTAQNLHLQKHEKPWDPDKEPLLINYKKEDKEAYDNIGRVITLLIEINGCGLELSEEECSDDFLVKVE